MQVSPLITLDRILEIDPARGGRAYRNVPNTLSIFDTHFPRFPVLPGVLILGSLGLLASLVLKERTGQVWRLAGAEQVRFRHFVQPGDQMELSVELKQFESQVATLSGSVRVDGQSMVTARQLVLKVAAASVQT